MSGLAKMEVKVTSDFLPHPCLPDTDLTKPTGVPPVQPKGVWRKLGTVDHVSFSSVAWIAAERKNLAKGACSTAALAWTHAHPLHTPHSAEGDVVASAGREFQ